MKAFKKFLVFLDGNKHELSPISYEEFTTKDDWCGANDIAYDDFLRRNGWCDIADFSLDEPFDIILEDDEGNEIKLDWSNQE